MWHHGGHDSVPNQSHIIMQTFTLVSVEKQCLWSREWQLFYEGALDMNAELVIIMLYLASPHRIIVLLKTPGSTKVSEVSVLSDWSRWVTMKTIDLWNTLFILYLDRKDKRFQFWLLLFCGDRRVRVRVRYIGHYWSIQVSELANIKNTIIIVCPSKRENKNNAYAEFWRDKQRVLWYFWYWLIDLFTIATPSWILMHCGLFRLTSPWIAVGWCRYCWKGQ